MSFSVFEKIDPSCQNGSIEKAKNLPYHQRPYASIAERTLVDISIYSPRPQIAGTGHSHSKISIHSPRAGRDCRYPNAPLITQISIHSPHTGRDRLVNAPIVSPSLFQSTLPAWGETRVDSNGQKRKIRISIHSPRMGRDAVGVVRVDRPLRRFQSTLPAWGETAGSAATGSWRKYFNPLSPHGERHALLDINRRMEQFQSTLPAWGETRQSGHVADRRDISIHSPRMGRDDWRESRRLCPVISIHSPRMGRDDTLTDIITEASHFNPLSPHGERPTGGARQA